MSARTMVRIRCLRMLRLRQLRNLPPQFRFRVVIVDV